MSDAPYVFIGETSPHEVAYKLLQHIAWAEKKAFAVSGSHPTDAPQRKWILDTYAECLQATTGRRVTKP